jgi:FkbM family methyltransferase
LVFDLGGYQGQWTSDIFARYCCTIHIFEPVPIFAEKIAKRFAGNPKVYVHNFGLGKETCNVRLHLSADGSSVFTKRSEETILIKIVKIDDFIRDNEVKFIDLIKINIEGGEYELLEHLLNSNYVENVNDIQVQFHDCVQDAQERMQAIQRQLEKTHHITYQYPFVWENWTRN